MTGICSDHGRRCQTVVGCEGEGEGLLEDSLTLGTLWQAPLTPPHPPRVAGQDRIGSGSEEEVPLPSTPSSDGSVTKLRLAELMQYLSPVGLGPSSKTCPRWLPHSLHDTSVLIRLGSAIILSRLPPTEIWCILCFRTCDGKIKRSTHHHLHPFCSWYSLCWSHRKMKASLSQNHILSWRRTDQCHRQHICMFPSPSVCSKHCCIAWQREEHYLADWQDPQCGPRLTFLFDAPE